MNNGSGRAVSALVVVVLSVRSRPDGFSLCVKSVYVSSCLLTL